MKRIALTGGMGTGKIHVRAVFAALGVATFDADTLARDVVAHGTPGFDGVVISAHERVRLGGGDERRRSRLGEVESGRGRRR